MKSPEKSPMMTPVNSITNLHAQKPRFSLPVTKKRAITMPTQFDTEKELYQPKMVMKSPRIEVATPRSVKK